MDEVLESTSEDRELLSAMEELQRAQDRVAKLREQNRERAIADVVEKIRMYGLQPEELGFEGSQADPVKRKMGAPGSRAQKEHFPAEPATAKNGLRIGRRAHVQAKYQGPEGASQQWSGRGKLPKWMVPLLENGAKKEDFLVQRLDDGNKE